MNVPLLQRFRLRISGEIEQEFHRENPYDGEIVVAANMVRGISCRPALSSLERSKSTETRPAVSWDGTSDRLEINPLGGRWCTRGPCLPSQMLTSKRCVSSCASMNRSPATIVIPPCHFFRIGVSM